MLTVDPSRDLSQLSLPELTAYKQQVYDALQKLRIHYGSVASRIEELTPDKTRPPREHEIRLQPPAVASAETIGRLGK